MLMRESGHFYTTVEPTLKKNSRLFRRRVSRRGRGNNPHKDRSDLERKNGLSKGKIDLLELLER